VSALNRRGDAGSLIGALSVHAEVVRCDPGGPDVAERFVGMDAIARWLQRMPYGLTFALEERSFRPVEDADGRSAVARYSFEGRGAGHGGEWRVTVTPDGLIDRLVHAPDAIA
jgi:hypothetical protein